MRARVSQLRTEPIFAPHPPTLHYIQTPYVLSQAYATDPSGVIHTVIMTQDPSPFGSTDPNVLPPSLEYMIVWNPVPTPITYFKPRPDCVDPAGANTYVEEDCNVQLILIISPTN